MERLRGGFLYGTVWQADAAPRKEQGRIGAAKTQEFQNLTNSIADSIMLNQSMDLSR
jgi:hypothetical protein